MLMRRLGFLMIAVLISTGTVIGARSWLQSQLAAREPPPVQPTVAAIENRMVLVTKGEPISDGRVVRPGDRGFMAAVLTPGNRAVTVPVTPSSGLAGFVFPGDRVDVILTMTIQPDKEGEKVEKERRASETVLTGIRVLATDLALLVVGALVGGKDRNARGDAKASGGHRCRQRDGQDIAQPAQPRTGGRAGHRGQHA